MKEKSYTYELDEAHPYAVAIQKARDSAEENLRHEWLYGDRSDTGLLGRAEKHYGRGDAEFSYDEKTDTVTVELSDEIIHDWKECGNFKRKTQKAIREWLANDIYYTAQANHASNKARAEKRREEYARTRAYQAERAIAAEKRRKDKILGA